MIAVGYFQAFSIWRN